MHDTGEIVTKAGIGLGGALWAFLSLPWDAIAGIATTIYMLICIVQRLRKKKE